MSLRRLFEGALLELGWEKVRNFECMFVHRKLGLFLSVYVDDIKMAGKKQNMGPMFEEIDEKCWSWRTNFRSGRKRWNQQHFLTNHFWAVHRKCLNYQCLLEQLKNDKGGKCLTQRRLRCPTTWKDMLNNALKDTANWRSKRQQLYKVSSPCLDGHQFKKEELESVRELSVYAHKLS